jgi:hypothetical protein
MKYVSFPWPPFEAALSIVNDNVLLKTIFEKELIQTKETAINAKL